MIVHIVNKSKVAEIKYKFRFKNYLLCVNNNDFILLKLEDLSIVFRTISNDSEKTRRYINKSYVSSKIKEITFQELEKLIVVPPFEKKEKQVVVKKEQEGVKEVSLFLKFKIEFIKYIDYYDVRNLENEKLIPEFKKIDDYTLEVYFTNESEGNCNKIVYNLVGKHNKKIRHFYNDKLIKTTDILNNIFK